MSYCIFLNCYSYRLIYLLYYILHSSLFLIMKAVVGTITKFIIVALCLVFIVFVIWKLYRDNLALQGEDAIYWPPDINKCPDYWTYKSDGKCHRDGNVTDPLVGNVGEAQLLEKCEEMKAAGIPWEGIDNLC